MTRLADSGLPPTRARHLFVICTIVIVAACNIALPFAGDQSLFALGARHILSGDVLYRDFWDLKQPGIFWFFAAARLAFGAGPVAVHLLEALWFFALSAALFVAAKRLFAAPHMRLIAPLLGAGYAQLVLTPDSATQVEALVALPLVVALWLSVEAIRGTRRAPSLLFGAGFAAAVAVCFKFLFVVAIAFMGLALIVAGARRDGLVGIRKCSIRAASALIVGFAVPLIASVLWFWAHGVLGSALATWFVVPADIVHELPHQSIAVLLGSARGYVITFLPLIVLAMFGLAAVRRGDVLAWGAVGWLVGGFATILLQVTSWWPYQWFLLATPTGLLATFGMQRFLRNGAARNGYAVAFVAVLLIGYPAVRAHAKLIGLARHGFALNAVQREAYQEELTPALARAHVAARQLESAGLRNVFVLGNPILYETLGTLQPIAVNGWLPELLTQRTRAEFMMEMCNAPPRSIYIDDAASTDVARLLERSPEFVAFLGVRYRHGKTRFGQLYVRRDRVIGSCPAEPRISVRQAPSANASGMQHASL